ncbi:MAG TPA: hypothetical protein VHE30_00415 [Polyangiaceae bacterium]|nr:hypothetical protein [Polyangiaceae bacterium]
MRQSLRVYSGDPSLAIFLQPDYDVVERVVTFRLADGGILDPGLLYHVDLFEPEADDGAGFLAFDGAPLERGDAPLHFSFRTARAVPAAPPTRKTPTCDDTLAVFADACSACHAGTAAFMGLRLESGSDLRETAISHVARETEGPRAGTPLVDPARFGVGMPLVDPGSPASSYLVYKLLAKAENFGSDCSTIHRAALPPGVCPLATDGERGRLGDWFVRLAPMPENGALLGGLDDLRTVVGYIRAGASTSSCSP